MTLAISLKVPLGNVHVLLLEDHTGVALDVATFALPQTQASYDFSSTLSDFQQQGKQLPLLSEVESFSIP